MLRDDKEKVRDLRFQTNLFERHDLIGDPVAGFVDDAVSAFADFFDPVEVLHFNGNRRTPDSSRKVAKSLKRSKSLTKSW